MNEPDPSEFLRKLTDRDLKTVDRAVALLWWHELTQVDAGSVADIAREIERAGYGQQNATRLTNALERDPRTSKTRRGVFRIRATAQKALDDQYLPLVAQRQIARSNAVLPLELFAGTRLYIERVALQINASYEANLFDCCSVMCRRLLETLIIEVYEAVGRADELKGPDGHFLMFSGLLTKIERDRAFNLGRNTLQGLRDFKALGDLSAHNRRFNARLNDIDRIRSGLRVATEELLTISGLSSSVPRRADIG